MIALKVYLLFSEHMKALSFFFLLAAFTAQINADANTGPRSRLMREMERLLFIRIEDCYQRGIPISWAVTQSKALSLFAMLKEKLDLSPEELEETFNASKGWWHRYSKRMDLGSKKIHGEAASADHEGGAQYPEVLKIIIEEGSYSEHQIFYCCHFLQYFSFFFQYKFYCPLNILIF